MKKQISNVILGFAFILAGIGFAGDSFGWWNFNLFFHGWWTLFIIIPCLLSLVRDGINAGSVIGLAIGVTLLLSAWNILPWYMVGRLIVPLIFVAIGVQIVFGQMRQRRFQPPEPHFVENPQEDQVISAVLWGRNERVTGIFQGARITAVLGGVELDLRSATITQDVRIMVTAVLGGVDIFVPQNVRVRVKATPILGGVDNRAAEPEPALLAHTIYVDAVCTLGGVDIK